MVRVGRDRKDNLVPHPSCHVAGHLTRDQLAPNPVQLVCYFIFFFFGCGGRIRAMDLGKEKPNPTEHQPFALYHLTLWGRDRRQVEGEAEINAVTSAVVSPCV